MVGMAYDLLENPLGAVRRSFDAAASAAEAAGDPVAAFRTKDWGAVDLFRSFLFDQGGLSQVPILDASSLAWIRPNMLVRFRGMVQDMLGNELYIGAFKDGSSWKTNKFTDISPFPTPVACEKHLWERHLFHCVPVPGQNSWAVESSPRPIIRDIPTSSSLPPHGEKRPRDMDSDDLDISLEADIECPLASKKQKDESVSTSFVPSNQYTHEPWLRDGIPSPSFSCLVKVYDMPDGQIKLNDVIEFIGIYTFDPELAVQKDDADDLMYDLLEDVTDQLPPSNVPRLHCVVLQKLNACAFLPQAPSVELSPQVLREIRGSLLDHFSAMLGNDTLAAQCLLLHLLSRIWTRVDMVMVGMLSLNLTNFTRESASIFGSRLNNCIQRLVPFSQFIPVTLDYLNTAALQPRRENQTGRLVTGLLQLAEGTHLMFDETHLNSGTLNSKGIENVSLLKNLAELQNVNYDFEYYRLEMSTDVQLLVLSEGKSNILPTNLVVPFCPSNVPEVHACDEKLQAWRWYLAAVKSLQNSTETSTYQTIQNDMVEAMRLDRTLDSSELSRMLTMAQIMSASFGEKSMSIEHWYMVKELERLRKERMACPSSQL